jgi:predicted nucleic acid-binding Zn ribbon protein
VTDQQPDRRPDASTDSRTDARTDPGTDPGTDARSGLDVARAALAAARAEARRRGLATRPGGSRGGGTGDVFAPGRRSRRVVDTSTRSGAHPDDRDPQTLDAALGRLVAERGWETDAKVGGVLGRWAAIVGPELAAHCEPVSFADGQLVVAASSTAWATQLRLLAPRLVRRLADELGDGIVTQVTVQGPRPPSWGKGPWRVRGRGPRDTYG